MEWMRRKNFLSAFMSHDNWMIRTIARIESMPTMVWRKILWRYNIDFMSLESFLRRLSPEQATAIVDNYEDLCVRHDIPRVFSKWDRFWGKITMEKILSEGYVHDDRYCNKAAMSYNLLDLDFGFNKYPNGVNDDEMVVEVSPFRFLSVKNHVNDFVVNTEGGRYWRFYRTARSNYAWFPNWQVELETHICPGFWYTLLIHLLFWVISPLFFMTLVGAIVHRSSSIMSLGFTMFTGIPGMFTPLWLLLATDRYVVEHMPKVKILNSLGGFITKQLSKIFTEDNALLAVVIALLCIIEFESWKIYCVLEPAFGIVWSILIVLSFQVYIGYKIHCDISPNIHEDGMMTYPLYFRIPLLVTAVSVVIKFFFVYPPLVLLILLKNTISFMIGGLINLVSGFFAWSWHALVAIGPWNILFAVSPWILLAVVWRITSWEEDERRKVFDRLHLDKIIAYLAWIVWGIFTIAIVWIALLNIKHSSIPSIFVGFFVAVVLTISYFFAIKADPKVGEAIGAAGYIKKNMLDGEDVSYNMFLKNAWYQSLDCPAKMEVAKNVSKLVASIFEWKSRHRAFKILVPVMTLEILDLIEQNKESLQDLPLKLSIRTFKTMVRKKQSYVAALAIVQAEEVKREAMRQRAKVVWRMIKKISATAIYPLIFVFNLVRKVMAKLSEYVKTVKGFYEYFNSICPFITKREVLQIK
jgi:hypothetical protein